MKGSLFKVLLRLQGRIEGSEGKEGKGRALTPSKSKKKMAVLNYNDGTHDAKTSEEEQPLNKRRYSACHSHVPVPPSC
jgi:hypothetical protein